MLRLNRQLVNLIAFKKIILVFTGHWFCTSSELSEESNLTDHLHSLRRLKSFEITRLEIRRAVFPNSGGTKGWGITVSGTAKIISTAWKLLINAVEKNLKSPVHGGLLVQIGLNGCQYVNQMSLGFALEETICSSSAGAWKEGMNQWEETPHTMSFHVTRKTSFMPNYSGIRLVPFTLLESNSSPLSVTTVLIFIPIFALKKGIWFLWEQCWIGFHSVRPCNCW